VSLAVLFCGYRERSGIAAGVAFSRPHAESHNLNLTFDVGQRFADIPNPFECMATLPLQGEELVVMERNGIPLCYVINEDCQKNPRLSVFTVRHLMLVPKRRVVLPEK
jgi:hypothetical protein